MLVFSLRFRRQNSNMPYCYKGKPLSLFYLSIYIIIIVFFYTIKIVFLLTNSYTLYDLLKFNDKGHNRTMEAES